MISCIIIVALSMLLLWQEWRYRRRGLQMQENAARQIEAAARSASDCMRLLRAAGTELRDQGLALLGHAEAVLTPDAAEWAAIAAQLLAMADDLQDHAPPSPESRVLVKELIEIEPLVQQCIDAVAANLRPTQRLWHISPRLHELRLLGDRRALTQVLLRLLSNAARATRHLDWIEVDGESAAGHVVLSVIDEGNGAIVPVSRNAAEGRGLGFGLSVARSLVLAHGGQLMVEAVPGVGARVEVALPQ